MHHLFVKNPGKPALVCVPGLLGGPEDFRGLSQAIEEKFQVIYVDPNHARKEVGLSKISLEETKAVSFESSAPEIKTVLEEHGLQDAFFIGISLGGKIVYDFAIRYPDQFLGGVISDVGPSSFMESDLCRFVVNLVEKTDLNLPWDELKKSLKEIIPDRNLRSLIQSQISYPVSGEPGIWKTGMRGLRTMLRNNSIDDQVEAFAKADEALVERERNITVLVASHLSGITETGLKTMQRWPSLKLIPVKDAAHFLHVTHKDLLQTALINLY